MDPAVFKALSDPNRMKIFEMLSSQELCACKILDELHITQPTLSHHMSILTNSGLVKSRKEGQWMHYSLNTELVAEIRDFFDVIGRSGMMEIH